MNIVDPILFQCRINAEQPAICVPGAQLDLVSYAQLEYMINNVTRAVLPLGLQPGQIVGVLLQDKIFHIALLLALTRLGIVTVSCRGTTLPKELEAAAVITDSTAPFTNVERVIRGRAEWVLGSAEPVTSSFKAGGNELCRIILTSGSTGVPKAMALPTIS